MFAACMSPGPSKSDLNCIDRSFYIDFFLPISSYFEFLGLGLCYISLFSASATAILDQITVYCWYGATRISKKIDKSDEN